MQDHSLNGTKKRRFMTSELIGKFRSKADFLKFFKECLQLYTPPEQYINKDFLKQVLAEDKSLMELGDLRPINVPLYDELSVKKFYPKAQQDKTVMKFLPDPRPDGRLPDRVYFFNILNTVHPEYMKKVIEHANEQRMAATAGKQEQEAIQVSERWW